MAGTALRRIPFTATGLTVIAVLGVLLGTVRTPIADKTWSDAVSYGVPTFEDGHWWSIFTGAPFAVIPLFYIPILLSFAGFVGLAEYRFGTARTMLAWFAGQSVSVCGAVAIAAIGDNHWTSLVDSGPSGGTLAVAALLTASFTPRWRLTARIGLLGYVTGSILLVGSLADLVHLVAVLGALPLGPLFVRRPAPAGSRDRALDLLTEHGGGTLSWMTTWSGVRYFTGSDGYLAYRRHAGVAIVLGEPVGTADWRARATDEFAAFCTASGMVPCWFSVGADTTATLRGAGWRHVQVAEDTLIDLPELKFRGKAWQDVRTARNRAAKDGIEFRMVVLADAEPAIQRQVRAVSTSWLRGRRTPELGFTLGGVHEAMDPNVRVGIAVDAQGVVHGVTSWLPVMGPDGEPRGWTLDMMRRRDNGFRPVIEFLIAEACLLFQAEGAEVVSLSGAPLARTGTGLLSRLLDVTGRIMEPWYGFRSLHAFKAKFQPRYEPLYLAYRHPGDLPRIGTAILRAYLAKPASLGHQPTVSVPLPRYPVPAEPTGQELLSVHRMAKEVLYSTSRSA
jgi:lysylphosphatidylglycerol synthetase-like protein (DUF2156 family)